MERLTVEHIQQLRRSAAMADRLPPDQLQWLLDQAEHLVRDRERLEILTRQLTGPWTEVRAALNELHRLAGSAPG